MDKALHMLTTKSMFVVSYKTQLLWFITRKSLGPWRKIHGSILRSENPAHGIGFWDLEWKEQMVGHVCAVEQMWLSPNSLNVTWKELSDVLCNSPSRNVCSMLNCHKTVYISEKVVNQRTFSTDHTSSVRSLVISIWKLNWSSKACPWLVCWK